jgi:hydroxymethylglutaryl-CoA synthase
VFGIIAYGSYVPYNRLDRSLISGALGSGGGRGHRAVASFDEDTTSMGVEAARNAVRSCDVIPMGITFSTALPAYLDKTNATTIHAALAMPRSTWAVDALGSARSATATLMQACRNTMPTMAVMSDIRTGLPGGVEEANGGDAAAAFICGADSEGPVIAELIGFGSSTSEFLDRWREPGQIRSKVWEERFGEHAYLDHVSEAVPAALASAGLGAADLTKVVLTGLQARAVRSSVRAAGLSSDTLVDDLATSVGNSGAAHGGLLVASALDEASPGDVIAVVILADGCDVAIFRATDAIAGYSPHSTVADQVAAGSTGLDYAKFLTWRGYLDREPPRRPDPDRPAAPPSARSEGWKYGFTGSRDRTSGAIHLPPRRVSMTGGALDDMEPIRMADTPATVATFTIDRLAFSLSPPLVAAVIDFDGGGRFQSEMTDVDPESVAIGDRVEMSFRRLFTVDGVHNYFWKSRPIR